VTCDGHRVVDLAAIVQGPDALANKRKRKQRILERIAVARALMPLMPWLLGFSASWPRAYEIPEKRLPVSSTTFVLDSRLFLARFRTTLFLTTSAATFSISARSRELARESEFITGQRLALGNWNFVSSR
jgi:hypothetical protein